MKKVSNRFLSSTMYFRFYSLRVMFPICIFPWVFLPVVSTGFLSKTHVFNPSLQNGWMESFGLLDVAAVDRHRRRVFHFAHSNERSGSIGECAVQVAGQLFGREIGSSGDYTTIRRSCKKGKENRGGWYWKICLPSDQLLSTCTTLYKTLDRIKVIPRKTVSKR